MYLISDIQSKKDCRPVQHPPHQVAVSKVELKRLVELGVMKEVLEYTEWINSIIIVTLKKPGSSLRLCLDPKDLHKAIKRNRWYNRTIDDVLPELANSKYFSLLHLLWHIPLDKESSLLTTFNTYTMGQEPFGVGYAYLLG